MHKWLELSKINKPLLKLELVQLLFFQSHQSKLVLFILLNSSLRLQGICITVEVCWHFISFWLTPTVFLVRRLGNMQISRFLHMGHCIIFWPFQQSSSLHNVLFSEGDTMNGTHRSLSHCSSLHLCKERDSTVGTPCVPVCVLPPSPLYWALALFTIFANFRLHSVSPYWICLLSLQKHSALLWPKITFHLWCSLELLFYSLLIFPLPTSPCGCQCSDWRYFPLLSTTQTLCLSFTVFMWITPSPFSGARPDLFLSLHNSPSTPEFLGTQQSLQGLVRPGGIS